MHCSRLLMVITFWIVSINGAAANEASRVLILGDSLSAAYNITVDSSWPVLFQAKLSEVDPKLQVVNASISGETTRGGVERLPALLDKHVPDYLIIELGGNDGLRGFPFKETRGNLQQMIDMAIAREIQILLIGVRLPPNLGPAYNRRFQQTYESLAKQNPVSYLPRFLEGIAASDPKLMQDDGIHPTAIAQPKLAQRVFESFGQAFLQTREAG